MRQFQNKALTLAIAVVAMAGMAGCDSRSSRTEVRTQANVQSRSYLMDSQAFDLQTVVGLVKDQKVKDADELQTVINGTSGINNVDLDKDGQIDFVGVKETQADGNARALDFVAVPSSRQGEPVTIASISFSIDTTTNQLVVQGGYPDYVS